jgi:hypothetical protein
LKRLGEDMRDLERAVPGPHLRARILAALPDAPPTGAPGRSSRTLRRLVIAPAFAAMACAAVWVFAIILKEATAARNNYTRAAVVGNHAGVTDPTADFRTRTAANSGVGAATDPYTAAADRRFAQWMKDEDQRETVRLAANRASLAKALVAVRAPRARAGEAIRLAVAVPDMIDTRDRLAAWAKAVGGSVEGPAAAPHRSAYAPMVDTREAPAPLPGAAGDSPGFQVTLRVPAARLQTLAAVLKQAGAWGASTTELPSARSSSDPGRERSPAQSGAQVTRRAPVIADPPVPTAGAVRPTGSDQVSARDNGMVMLQIQLTSLETPLP